MALQRFNEESLHSVEFLDELRSAGCRSITYSNENTGTKIKTTLDPLPINKCSICNNENSTESSLCDHSRINDATTRRYTCSSCNQDFVTERLLKSHRKIHDGILVGAVIGGVAVGGTIGGLFGPGCAVAGSAFGFASGIITSLIQRKL